MQVFVYTVVTADNKVQYVTADSIKGVLEVVDEDEAPIVNIFRCSQITEGGVSHAAKVNAEVSPAVAFTTGCRAYPSIPVDTMQGKPVTLSASIAPGWKFDGWYVGTTKVADTPQATIINQYEGEVVYTAKFSPVA